MTELYEWPPTRSQRAKWALEEIGIAYKSQMINLTEGQQNSDAYRALHPLGVVPALKTDGYTIFESVAIVLQLIDENPEKNLAPGVGTPERAAYYQWCVFACAELDLPIMMFFDNAMRPLEFMRPPGAQHDVKLAERGRSDFGTRADILSEVLHDREYLVGSRFFRCRYSGWPQLFHGHAHRIDRRLPDPRNVLRPAAAATRLPARIWHVRKRERMAQPG